MTEMGNGNGVSENASSDAESSDIAANTKRKDDPDYLTEDD